ncbi:MAG: hypothetical protein AVDCRST_MAG02-2594 [uncultured Rubrobacteraceae bacterium]|uniref:2-isopropylmalate synthase LeuA allosteric (dimerisation) domain-containing protein n=1 Tax=uncultured Rubrobacteraceae bacterium TaxID=349277 RepID=A0A6J4R2X8_9ACTN|nr:MAG: hypothetical protein AVDCRST_MAG02-2594 [uncultured Rubrobacteraceae bacterium]
MDGCRGGFVLDRLRVVAVVGRRSRASASVSILRGGRSFEAMEDGEGAVDAVSRAVATALGIDARIKNLRTGGTRGGRGEVWVSVECEGGARTGYCASADFVEAVARAYLEALDVLVAAKPAGDVGEARTK